jgi:hypothetical protein
MMRKSYANFDSDRKYIFSGDGALEISDDLFLFSVSPVLVLKRIFLDDLHRPHIYTWIFKAVATTICHVYFIDRRHLQVLIAWIDQMKGISLPSTCFDVIAEIMIWPMVLAWLLQDWAFLEFLNFDYESLSKSPRATSKLARAIIKCLKVRAKTIPAKAIPSLEEICDSQGCSNFMGFDVLAVQAAFRDILPLFTSQKAITAVQGLILN